MPERSSDAEVVQILRSYTTIGVLGAHREPMRPACYVPDYMNANGYRILPVNPGLAGRELWGEPVRPSLADLGEPVDVVNVFRRAHWLPDHLPEILAMAPAPSVVWLQLGIRHADVAAALVAAGIDVVQDRCMLADHKRLIQG